MTNDTRGSKQTVNTVLGPVAADELGVVAVHESLVAVYPGAQYAFDVSIDRAEILAILKRKLIAFRDSGGGTIVDTTGMFHGRDVWLYQSLSHATGVHIIASTGMGPEAMLGGYFLTPQTNPPTPWPAEKFADLFTREITEGMVVPRVERCGAAGLVVTTGTRGGLTATDESLFRGVARTSRMTGVAASIRYGRDAATELDLVLAEGLSADRVIMGDMDRSDAVESDMPARMATKGAFVAIDHVGLNDDDDHITDAQRVDLVMTLIRAGHGDQIILSGNAIGVARGQADYNLPYEYVTTTFMPQLRAAGLSDADVDRILKDNPRRLLAVH